MLDRLKPSAARSAPRAVRAGGGTAPHRPGTARRGRPDPDRGPARLKRAVDRAPDGLAPNCTRCRRPPATASTRSAASRAGCAPACWRSSGCPARSRRSCAEFTGHTELPCASTSTRTCRPERRDRTGALPGGPGGLTNTARHAAAAARLASTCTPRRGTCSCASPTTAAGSAAPPRAPASAACANGHCSSAPQLTVGPAPGGGTEVRLASRPRRPAGPGPVTTRILLADDHALVRRGVRLILDGEPDLKVVAEAGDGARGLSRWPAATSTWPSWTSPCRG